MLVSPLGYSPTGEVFNLAWEDVAESTLCVRRNVQRIEGEYGGAAIRGPWEYVVHDGTAVKAVQGAYLFKA